MPEVTDFSRLRAGMTPDEALGAFAGYCNKQNTLFAPEHWFRPYRDKLRACLPGTIADDHVEAMREVLLEHFKIDVLLVWLTEAPELSWADFKAKLERAHELAQVEAIRAGFFPSDDVNTCRAQQAGEAVIPPGMKSLYDLAGQRSVDSMRAAATPCPFCASPFEELERVFFVSPPWTWQELCGRAGWLTICPKCEIQVQFFCDLMN